MMSWSPTGQTEAIEVIADLYRLHGWESSPLGLAMRDAVLTRTSDQRRDLRLLSRQAIPLMIEGSYERSQFLSDSLAEEPDLELFSAGIGILNSYVDLEHRDPVFERLSNSKFSGKTVSSLLRQSGSDEHWDLQRSWMAGLMSCHLYERLPYATNVISELFANPDDAPAMVAAATSTAREIFSSTSNDSAREKMVALLATSARSLSASLRDMPESEGAQLAADSIIQEIYHASGAFKHSELEPSALQKLEWFEQFSEIFRDLSAVAHPHSVYHLIETLEFFIDEDPRKVFILIAASVKSESAFAYESLAVDAIVRIIERYLADHRQLLLEDSALMDELRRVLAEFTRVGWGEALRLAHTLGSAFR